MDGKEILKRIHNLLVEANGQISTLKNVVVVWFVLQLVATIVAAVAAASSMNAASQSEATLKSLQQELDSVRSTNSY